MGKGLPAVSCDELKEIFRIYESSYVADFFGEKAIPHSTYAGSITIYPKDPGVCFLYGPQYDEFWGTVDYYDGAGKIKGIYQWHCVKGRNLISGEETPNIIILVAPYPISNRNKIKSVYMLK